MTATITLTSDQQSALNSIYQFLIDPVETVFVLSGYSGCGKSTLVRALLDSLPNYLKTARLIDPKQKSWEVALTATTNKAAENLGRITGDAAVTIHSFLGLRVETNYTTGQTKLIPRNADQKEGYLVLIDEASYIDGDLLNTIFKKTKNCKLIFIGDPAQLTPVKAVGTPVFDANFTGAALTQVVRQAEGNPIVDLSTKFRHTVNTGEFFSFKPDGHHVKYMDRDAFNEAIKQEFTRPDWKYADSKILGWTNKCVIGFNHYVASLVSGTPDFQVGDYAVCNSFITVNRISFKTDQLVEITRIVPNVEHLGVPGTDFELDNKATVFMPLTLESKNARIRKAKAEGDMGTVAEIDQRWVDLRSCFACTINKSQGSTFDKVFIDLDDVQKVNSGNTLARLLYVAVSRARDQVFLTGDIH